MDTFYCHNCLAQHGIHAPTMPQNITANKYQASKFAKHTTQPSTIAQTLSVFSDPSYVNYYGLMMSAVQFGIGAIDCQGRPSLVFDAAKPIGTTLVAGYQRSDNAIRLVSIDDPQKLHGYTTAVHFSGQTCSQCGSALILQQI